MTDIEQQAAIGSVNTLIQKRVWCDHWRGENTAGSAWEDVHECSDVAAAKLWISSFGEEGRTYRIICVNSTAKISRVKSVDFTESNKK